MYIVLLIDLPRTSPRTVLVRRFLWPNNCSSAADGWTQHQQWVLNPTCDQQASSKSVLLHASGLWNLSRCLQPSTKQGGSNVSLSQPLHMPIRAHTHAGTHAHTYMHAHTHVYTHTDLLKVLAHTLLKAKKSHDSLPANCRARRAV